MQGERNERGEYNVRVVMHVYLSSRELAILDRCDEIESEKRRKTEKTTKARTQTSDESGERSGKQ